MLRNINGTIFNFIGDPHMGKRFPDVPLHRRGEREAMQLQKLKDELNVACSFNIMVGDLFDTFDVDNDVLMDVYMAIRDAAKANPLTKFYWMSGNHDISRNADVIHSFDVLKEMLRTLAPQVLVVTETTHIVAKAPSNMPDVHDDDYKFDILLCPYSSFKTSVEEVEPYQDKQFDLVVGHWDCTPIGGTHNLIPGAQLVKMTEVVVTGHEHTQEEFYLDATGNKTVKPTGVVVAKTGSMQPYSHGEDPHGEFYVTRTLEQVTEALALDANVFHNKCVRLVLSGNEQPPLDFDCLQFAIKRVDTSIEELYEENLDDNFSFKGIFDETFKENGLDEATTTKYWDKYKQEANNAE